MSRQVVAGTLLGIGLGGLFDGIVLHQILQWHHMVSSVTPPDSLANLETNTLGDGLFHALAWLTTLAGVWLLMGSRAGRSTPGLGTRLLGGMLVGWGGFNLVEGLVDHHILGLHHVRPGPDGTLYDLGFLVWGAGMCIIGAWLVRSSRAHPDPSVPAPIGLH